MHAPFLDLLRAGQYEALDRELSDVQAAFEGGERSERELERAFAPFEQPDPALGEKFSEWMEARPGSYGAHTALARWCLARAWAYRGGTTFNLVSDRGRRGMHHFLEQAEGCARHATTLTGNPLSAWLVVASVHNTQGCELSLEDLQAGRYPEWFTRPLAGNPHSLDLRRTMLLHLRTEWGGSEEHMLTFVRQQ